MTTTSSIGDDSTTTGIINHQRPLVLMYHSISDPPDNPNDLWISPRLFEAQMNSLRASGLRGVSVSELRTALSEGRGDNMVGLTFDDGYRDFLLNATPIMEKFGFSGTVFAVSGLVGEENDWYHHFHPRPRMDLMGEDELREVTALGMEVGAHTVSHPRLPDLDPDEAREELIESRRVLSDILGEDVKGFCFPYGKSDARLVRLLPEAGYEYGCVISDRPVRSEFDFPRIGVRRIDNPVRFIAKVVFYRSALGRWKLF